MPAHTSPAYKAVLKSVGRRIVRDDVVDVSARLAFYLFFAMFPVIIVAAALLSVLHMSAVVPAILKYLYAMLPASVAPLVQRAISGMLSHNQDGALSIGILFTLWAASSGVVALLDGANAALEVKSSRGFIRERLLAIALSILLLLIAGIGLSLVVWGGPVDSYLFSHFHPGPAMTVVWHIIRYAVTFVLFEIMVQILYYAAPQKHTNFKWMTTGAIIAVVGIGIASALLGFYLVHFGSSYAAYGPIGAVMGVLLLLQVSGIMYMIGAEWNAALLKQTLGTTVTGETAGPQAVPGRVA